MYCVVMAFRAVCPWKIFLQGLKLNNMDDFSSEFPLAVFLGETLIMCFEQRLLCIISWVYFPATLFRQATCLEIFLLDFPFPAMPFCFEAWWIPPSQHLGPARSTRRAGETRLPGTSCQLCLVWVASLNKRKVNLGQGIPQRLPAVLLQRFQRFPRHFLSN